MSTYLITGANRGIGRATAEALAEEDLLLLGRDPDALAAMAATLPHARPVVADLAAPDGIADAVARADLPDRLDGVVHSAGWSVNGRVEDLSAADWTGQLAINVVAVAELTRLLLPALRAAQGTVVMVNSGAGRRVVRPASAAYSASKHALVAVADGLRLEEPELRVTTVFPGRVATDMQRELREFEGGEYRVEDYVAPETVAAVIASVLRLPTDATMPDVAVIPNSK